MKTISDYTIYCTSEQTKQAFELGAPIENMTGIFPTASIDGVLYDIPTAEQMIGWLRDNKGIYIFPIFAKPSWTEYTIDKRFSFSYSFGGTFLIEDKSCYTSYEEALLAGIDKALNYLKNNRK